MKLKLAKCISVIGHPLLTIPLFVILVMFSSNDLHKAILVTLLIVGCVFVPAILIMYIKSKNGSYTNFEVSDRQQRKSMFLYILPLLVAVTLTLFITKQPTNICISVLFATLLVFVSQLVNYFIKSSLHVSLNIYLSFLVATVNFPIGFILFLFTALLGWSRVALGRHSLKEVIVGCFLGLFVSVLMIYAEGYI